MYCDEFKARYTTVPFATFKREHIQNDCEADMTTLPHIHREIELLPVLDGKAKTCINGVFYPLEKGDIVIVAPYRLHSTTIYRECDFKHYCMCFDMSLLGDETLKESVEHGRLGFRPIIHRTDNGADELRRYLLCAYAAHEAHADGWEWAVKGFLCVFFSVLRKNGYLKPQNADGKETAFFRQTLALIEGGYAEKLTSRDMANALHMSESYFCRIFKRNFGHRFQNYVCAFRIEKAKDLLRTTDRCISDIAMETGFNSFSFFTKSFRECVGITPSEYRKKASKFPYPSVEG